MAREVKVLTTEFPSAEFDEGDSCYRAEIGKDWTDAPDNEADRRVVVVLSEPEERREFSIPVDVLLAIAKWVASKVGP